MKAYALQFLEQDDAGWSPADRSERDYCTEDGAAALKATIEAYWAQHGQHVMISLQNVGFHPAIRAARFDVRSDMINGKPRGPGRSQKLGNVFVEDFDREDDDLSFE